jgi:hypothetical protein
MESRKDGELPYKYEHPMTVLLKSLGLEPRTPRNHPHYFLRLVTFVAPSMLIFGVGQFLVARDLATTVAGALLGVQLAGPYRVARQVFLRNLRQAQESHLPLSSWFRYRSGHLARGLVAVANRINYVPVSDDPSSPDASFRVVQQTKVLRVRTVLVMRLRARRLERLWKRHFLDVMRWVMPDHAVEPAAELRADDPDAWPWPLRNRIIAGMSRRRAGRVLRRTGRLLRRADLLTKQPAPDAPARCLAEALDIHYPR